MGLFVTTHSSQPFRIHAIRAKFTADRIKNSTEGRREKKNLVEDSFQTAKKKRESQKLLVLAQNGEGQSLSTQRGHKTMDA